MTAKKSAKTGKNFRGGGEEFFWLARIYTPAPMWRIRIYYPQCVVDIKISIGEFKRIKIRILILSFVSEGKYSIRPAYIRQIGDNFFTQNMGFSSWLGWPAVGTPVQRAGPEAAARAAAAVVGATGKAAWAAAAIDRAAAATAGGEAAATQAAGAAAANTAAGDISQSRI